MTGEMYAIDPHTGREPDGTEWPFHAAAAQALGGIVKPFDQYQGPYVLSGPDVRIGAAPYAVAPTDLGVVRLWLCPADDMRMSMCWFREDTQQASIPFLTPLGAAQAARSILGRPETQETRAA